MSQSTGSDAAEIYVVLRVFNLGKPNMGMRVYVDPEYLRQESKLEFTAESWTVIPSSQS